MRRVYSWLVSAGILASAAMAVNAHAEGVCVEQDLSGKRIVFLGDSITFAGHYVAYVEAVLREKYPQATWNILNLGLPSETVSGLSEPSHPFPRPTVHERLDRVLARTRPDWVFACYGINDGIYHPFSPERFQAYREGITRLIEKVDAAGARLILLTPAPFDPEPLRGKGGLRSCAETGDFSWTGIYEHYDEVMATYSRWILEMKDPRVVMSLDIRTPILSYLKERRQHDPQFFMAGDGIHLNEEGHQILARGLLVALGLSGNLEPAPDLLKWVTRKEEVLRDAWLFSVGHQRPGMRQGPSLEEAAREVETFEEKIHKISSSTSPER